MSGKPELSSELSRDLSLFHITMMGLGMMIGAGVFLGIGNAVAHVGPGGVLLTFALNGVLAMFTAMSYAELSSAIPRAGGAYNFARLGFGRGTSFVAGWMEWFASSVAGSLYAVTFAIYLVRFVGIILGLELSGTSLLVTEKTVALVIAVFFIYINYRGASETGRVGAFFTLGQTIFLVFIGVVGLIVVARDPSRLQNFTPFMPAGWGKLLGTMGFTYVAFEGYEVIAQAGDEVVDARRNLPKAMIYSVLIAPNHSDHCDPHGLISLARRWKIPFHFVAAREIFDKQRGLHGFVLQRAGVFSIDREGADIQAIKTAMRILFQARFPLVMFPEGEIYHLNEKLTPLNEGAATLALKTAARIRKEKEGAGAFIVPTAMKYRYVDDISTTFGERMTRLEDRILWAPQDHLNVVDRIYKFGEAALSLKEKEFLDRTLEGTLDGRLQTFREMLVAEEENRYFSKTDDGNHPTRIRRLRGKIRTILLNEKKPSDDEAIQCYRSLDRLYMAIQLYSYPGQYLRDNPSMDRIAETIHKFEEDAFGYTTIPGRRTVEITFCEPVNLLEHLDAPAKEATHEVTALIESAIRKVLE
ncbi:amino acid permease [Verrucomicrobiota bacterium]